MVNTEEFAGSSGGPLGGGGIPALLIELFSMYTLEIPYSRGP